jgi:hypothetical protein
LRIRSLLLLGLGVPALVMAGLGTWVWTGLTAQPPMDWASTSAGNSSDDRQKRLDQAKFQVWFDVHRQLRANHSAPVRLNASQVQTVLAADIARINTPYQQSGPVLQAIAVQLSADRLTSATRFNLANISAAQMDGTQRVALLRLFKQVPGLAQRSIVVAIEGRPILTRPTEGQAMHKNPPDIGLDRVTIRVGRFRWSIAEASRYLQVPPSYIEDIIDRELTLVPMEDFTQIVAQPDALLIQGDGTAF